MRIRSSESDTEHLQKSSWTAAGRLVWTHVHACIDEARLHIGETERSSRTPIMMDHFQQLVEMDSDGQLTNGRIMACGTS